MPNEKPLGDCANCKRFLTISGRGLCGNCYRQPSVRAQYKRHAKKTWRLLPSRLPDKYHIQHEARMLHLTEVIAAGKETGTDGWSYEVAS